MRAALLSSSQCALGTAFISRETFVYSNKCESYDGFACPKEKFRGTSKGFVAATW